MTKPPFDVSIPIGLPARGVYRVHPICSGWVDGPTGELNVVLGLQTLAPRPGAAADSQPPPTQLTLKLGETDTVLTIDLTEMLERIVREYYKPDDQPPPRELTFRTRG